jgi:hypothetical protein
MACSISIDHPTRITPNVTAWQDKRAIFIVNGHLCAGITHNGERLRHTTVDFGQYFLEIPAGVLVKSRPFIT